MAVLDRVSIVVGRTGLNLQAATHATMARQKPSMYIILFIFLDACEGDQARSSTSSEFPKHTVALKIVLQLVADYNVQSRDNLTTLKCVHWFELL